MLSPEERLKRTAMSFGAWRVRANKTRTTADRINFVRAETALGQAAQAFFETTLLKEQGRDARRRNKN